MARYATFLVTIPAPIAVPATVWWATQDGTATAALDYIAASGFVTILAGTMASAIAVALRDETTNGILNKPPLTFSVRIWAGNGAVLGRSIGTVTIPGYTADGIGQFAIGVSGIGQNSEESV